MDAEQSGWDRPLLSDLPMEVALEDTVLGTLNGLAFSAGCRLAPNVRSPILGPLFCPAAERSQRRGVREHASDLFVSGSVEATGDV
ncbi:MAG: hypothetical protein OXE53_18760, partial [Deltaproteobacteria bacterium]|nr:hypothetical protein [Deltaproteobacteria bacterium]